MPIENPIQAKVHSGTSSRRRLPLFLTLAALVAVSLVALMSRPPVVVQGTSGCGSNPCPVDPGPRALPAGAGNFYSALTPNQQSITTRLTQIFT